jgi:hypothetical protein
LGMTATTTAPTSGSNVRTDRNGNPDIRRPYLRGDRTE